MTTSCKTSGMHPDRANSTRVLVSILVSFALVACNTEGSSGDDQLTMTTQASWSDLKLSSRDLYFGANNAQGSLEVVGGNGTGELVGPLRLKITASHPNEVDQIFLSASPEPGPDDLYELCRESCGAPEVTAWVSGIEPDDLQAEPWAWSLTMLVSDGETIDIVDGLEFSSWGYGDVEILHSSMEDDVVALEWEPVPNAAFYNVFLFSGADVEPSKQVLSHQATNIELQLPAGIDSAAAFVIAHSHGGVLAKSSEVMLGTGFTVETMRVSAEIAQSFMEPPRPPLSGRVFDVPSFDDFNFEIRYQDENGNLLGDAGGLICVECDLFVADDTGYLVDWLPPGELGEPWFYIPWSADYESTGLPESDVDAVTPIHIPDGVTLTVDGRSASADIVIMTEPLRSSLDTVEITNNPGGAVTINGSLIADDLPIGVSAADELSRVDQVQLISDSPDGPQYDGVIQSISGAQPTMLDFSFELPATDLFPEGEDVAPLLALKVNDVVDNRLPPFADLVVITVDEPVSDFELTSGQLNFSVSGEVHGLPSLPADLELELSGGGLLEPIFLDVVEAVEGEWTVDGNVMASADPGDYTLSVRFAAQTPVSQTSIYETTVSVDLL